MGAGSRVADLAVPLRALDVRDYAARDRRLLLSGHADSPTVTADRHVRPDWRRSYQLTVAAYVSQILEHGHTNPSVPYTMPDGTRRRASTLSWDEIHVAAHHAAERDVRMAMRDWDDHRTAARRAAARSEAF